MEWFFFLFDLYKSKFVKNHENMGMKSEGTLWYNWSTLASLSQIQQRRGGRLVQDTGEDVQHTRRPWPGLQLDLDLLEEARGVWERAGGPRGSAAGVDRWLIQAAGRLPWGECWPGHTSYIILHISYIIHHTSYFTSHTSYIIHHTSYFISHTSYIIHHISYVIHHTSYVICHTSCIIHHSTSYVIHHTVCIIRHTAYIIQHSPYMKHHTLLPCIRDSRIQTQIHGQISRFKAFIVEHTFISLSLSLSHRKRIREQMQSRLAFQGEEFAISNLTEFSSYLKTIWLWIRTPQASWHVDQTLNTWSMTKLLLLFFFLLFGLYVCEITFHILF